MATLFWEDFTKNQVIEHGPRLVTREEIVAFAAEFDPQPMHLDEDVARASMLGGLAASGWHVCGVAMRLIAEGVVADANAMGSPGVEEVRWLRPLRPGDRVTLRATVLETRTSRSRANMGFVRFRFDLIDDPGDLVMTMRFSMMMTRRPAREGDAA